MSRAKALLWIPLFLLATISTAPAQEPSSHSNAGDKPSPSVRPIRTASSPARSSTLARGSQGWWLGTAFMIMVLGAAGAICIAAKKQRGDGSGVRLQVVGRVALAPKHAVYAVRAGSRTLLIGTGPQGAPALLGELDDESAFDVATPSSLARFDPAASTPRQPSPTAAPRRFDVRLGDDS